MAVADPFTAVLTGRLQSVRIAAYQLAGAVGTLRVGVYHGRDMNAATLLEEFLGAPPGPPSGVLAFASVLAPHLVAGDAYFVALSTSDPSAAYVWNDNDQGIATDEQIRLDPSGPWRAAAGNRAGAYSVTVATTAPEPGTWALLGTGLLAVGGARARRRRAR